MLTRWGNAITGDSLILLKTLFAFVIIAIFGVFIDELKGQTQVKMSGLLWLTTQLSFPASSQ